MVSRVSVMRKDSVRRATRKRFCRVLLAVSAAAVLAGCATSGNPKDPIEGFNRAMFSINEAADQAVLKPVAKAYDAVMPVPVRTGVSNFFGNIDDLFIGVNNLLQGKPADAISDWGRVLVNSTIGIFGLIDVASQMGMEKNDEDFGQTFGRWGVDEGAYVFIPFYGPRTVRDTVGLIVDVSVDPVANIDDDSTRYTLRALRVIDRRADLLPADKVIEEAALDKYAYVRDAYLQRRLSLIHDGNPPREHFE